MFGAAVEQVDGGAQALVDEQAQPAGGQEGLVDVAAQHLQQEQLAVLPDREGRAEPVAGRLVEEPQQGGEQPVPVRGGGGPDVGHRRKRLQQ